MIPADSQGESPPERIDIALLDQFPGFAEFRKKSAGIDGVVNEDDLGSDVA